MYAVIYLFIKKMVSCIKQEVYGEKKMKHLHIIFQFVFLRLIETDFIYLFLLLTYRLTSGISCNDDKI